MINYAKKHPYLLASFIILIGAIIVFASGNRIQPNFRIAKNGTLEVTLPLASTTVYIDNKKIKTTSIENETVSASLSTKTHSIIIGRDGYFPWTKDVAINSNVSSVIKPIFVTQNPTGQIITKNDPQYWNLRYKTEHVLLPTETKPKTLGGVSIWVANNTIYVRENNSVKSIITPVDTIRSLDFYKDRTDVIVFAADTGVYAIEAIENAATQKANFFPIYKGTKPVFEKTDNSFLYVVDGENLMMVVI